MADGWNGKGRKKNNMHIVIMNRIPRSTKKGSPQKGPAHNCYTNILNFYSFPFLSFYLLAYASKASNAAAMKKSCRKPYSLSLSRWKGKKKKKKNQLLLYPYN